jgi:hypothetical protein
MVAVRGIAVYARFSSLLDCRELIHGRHQFHEHLRQQGLCFVEQLMPSLGEHDNGVLRELGFQIREVEFPVHGRVAGSLEDSDLAVLPGNEGLRTFIPIESGRREVRTPAPHTTGHTGP